jgi:hypothetical protein
VNLPNRPGEGKLAARVLADAPRPEIWNQDAKERTK